jgi:ANTAR domain
VTEPAVLGDVAGWPLRHDSGALEEARERIRNLERELVHRGRILESEVAVEQATGMLAERFAVEVDEALRIMQDAADLSRMRLHVLAQRVLEARTTPGPLIVALARSQRERLSSMREVQESHRDRIAELEQALRQLAGM